MIEVIRPVRFGILIGLLAFIFGIGWAFWLVVGHERIHQSLDARAAVAAEKGVHEVIHSEPENGHEHPDEGMVRRGHAHEEGDHHGMGEMNMGGMTSAHSGAHDNPIMELSHTRLARGHVHAMGLGLVTVAVSLGLAFTSAPVRIKAIASVLTGIGALIYPLAWIVMGYRTPALGPEIAEHSVMTVAGTGASLVLLGVFTAAAFIIKDIFKKG